MYMPIFCARAVLSATVTTASRKARPACLFWTFLKNQAFVVVTRYFGGILLGGGGLVRAYSHAAHLALEAGKIITMGLCAILKIRADYAFHAKLLNFIEGTDAIVLHTEFSDCVTLTLSIAVEKADAFCDAVFDFSGGKVTPQKIREKFAEK